MKNPEISSSFSDLRLTKVESRQTRKRLDGHEEKMFVVNRFQREPDFRRAFLADPFNPEINKVGASIYEPLRLAILAEPEGEYKEISKEEQLEISASMTLRLTNYIESHLHEINKMNDRDLYKLLIKVAFGITNEDRLQTKYSLLQRRGFRLSIVNFLEDRHKLSDYRKESLIDSKAFAEKYLKQKFTGLVTIERLPVGFIIYLDEDDYALVQTSDRDPKSIKSAGVTLGHDYLPEDLRWRMVLVNRGGAKTRKKHPEEIENTKKHEVRHILFRSFHEQRDLMSLSDLKKNFLNCQTKDDYQKISQILFENFVEQTRDEIIAYFTECELNEGYQAIRLNIYNSDVTFIKGWLSDVQNLSESEKESILEIFVNDQKRCLETTRKIRLVIKKIWEKSFANSPVSKKKRSFGESINQEKIEALLQNTPGTKIHRLAKYAGLTTEDVLSDRILKEEDREITTILKNMSVLSEKNDLAWYLAGDQLLKEIKGRLNFETLPVLINTLLLWTTKINSDSFNQMSLLSVIIWIETAFYILEDFAKAFEISENDKKNIRLAIKNCEYHARSIDEFKKTVEQIQGLLNKIK